MARAPQAPGSILADILMACDPHPPSERPANGPKPALRPLGQYSIDEFVSELPEARLARDTGRLKRLLDETCFRRTKIAARLGARARLSLLALENPMSHLSNRMTNKMHL